MFLKQFWMEKWTSSSWSHCTTNTGIKTMVVRIITSSSPEIWMAWKRFLKDFIKPKVYPSIFCSALQLAFPSATRPWLWKKGDECTSIWECPEESRFDTRVGKREELQPLFQKETLALQSAFADISCLQAEAEKRPIHTSLVQMTFHFWQSKPPWRELLGHANYKNVTN